LINEVLQGDEDVKKVIPINPENDDIFSSMEDGIVMAVENTIDMRAMNMKDNMNIYMVKENLNLALNAGKGIGLKLPGISSQAFIEKKPHLILAVLW
jgi:plastin-1